MGRLDNIIRRNRRGGRPTERTMVSIGIGLVVLLILFLAVFTDLGRATPDHSLSPPPPSPPSSPRPDTHDKDHVDGVYLGR